MSRNIIFASEILFTSLKHGYWEVLHHTEMVGDLKWPVVDEEKALQKHICMHSYWETNTLAVYVEKLPWMKVH
jgi:hypothetical protein